MSWLSLPTDEQGYDFKGLGTCCPDCPPGLDCAGLGQAADPVTGVVNLISSIIGAGAGFIPETKEMRRRREAAAELERERLQVQRIRSALTSKTAITGFAILGGLGLLWIVLGRRRRK